MDFKKFAEWVMFIASILDIVVTGYKPAKTLLSGLTALGFLFWLGVAVLVALGIGKYREWINERFGQVQKSRAETEGNLERKIKDLENTAAVRINTNISTISDLATRIGNIEGMVREISMRLSVAGKSEDRSSKDS